MAKSPPHNTTATNAPALRAEGNQVTTSPDGASPAATADSTEVLQTPMASTSQDQGSAEAAPIPAMGAGPPTTVEADPAPIQPPIQPVSILATKPYLL
jgi:hypothetical protein